MVSLTHTWRLRLIPLLASPLLQSGCFGIFDFDDLSASLPYILEARRFDVLDFDSGTAIDASGRLTFYSEFPTDLSSCQSELGEAGGRCTDDDHDGLVDDWELLLLAKLRPIVRMHPTEPLLGDYASSVYLVGRVTPMDGALNKFFVPMVLAYSKDYGSCTVGEHFGDSERVVLRVERDERDPFLFVVTGAYTAAHEGTVTDGSERFVDSGLSGLTLADDPVSQMPRWLVFSSRSKHATYATKRLCDAHASGPCVAEACPPDDPDRSVDLLFDVVNAGEPSTAENGDLWSRASRTLAHDGWRYADFENAYVNLNGLFDEYAWRSQGYCGGHLLGSRKGCASALEEKLTQNPF